MGFILFLLFFFFFYRGFLNPFLYANPTSFRDIVDGESTPGGMVSSSCGQAQNGWPATKGYDLATGLGVPDFGKLRSAALNGTSWTTTV